MNKAIATALIAAIVASSLSATAVQADDGWKHGNQHWKGPKHGPPARYYGNAYNYGRYVGPWRSGQVFPYYADTRYVVYDYARYGLPAPAYGYRYYHTDSGDILLAAIAGGLIGWVLGGAYGHPGGYPAPVPVPVPPPAPVPAPPVYVPRPYYPPPYYPQPAPPPYYPPGPYYPY